MKKLKLLLALALGMAVLAPGTAASAQVDATVFEEAEGPDDTCDLRIIRSGPYEVSVDGGPITLYEDGSVIAVPQGGSVWYLRAERVTGFTATGSTERCEVFESAEQAAELAVTGSETTVLVIGGVVLVAAGFQFVALGRRSLS